MTLRPLAVSGLLIAATCGALALSQLSRIAPQDGAPDPAVSVSTPAAPETGPAAPAMLRADADAVPEVAPAVPATLRADHAPAPAPAPAHVPSLPADTRLPDEPQPNPLLAGSPATPPAATVQRLVSPFLITPDLIAPGKVDALAAVAPGAGLMPRLPVSLVAPQKAALVDALPKTDESALEAQGVGPVFDPITRLTVKAQRGDTLGRLLIGAGASPAEVHAAVDSMGSVFDPRDLQPGHELELSFLTEQDEDGTVRKLGRLQGIQLAAAIDRDVAVRATPEGGFVAEASAKPVRRVIARNNGEIVGGSLLAAGMSSGVPAAVMTEIIRVFSFDVDFQRDIQPGDRFDLMYERFHLADGRLVRGGDVMYAALTLSGKTQRLYRYKDSSGRVDFYNELGHSVRKALLKTPVDGAKLTSRFGMRNHPILGYTVMHRGVDFGAPPGTPIYAAGDGTIAILAMRSGYGRYINIRHNGSYSTAYAHMSAYAKGLKAGSRVRQGQVIGYVGASGRVTGPHLHYEVLRDGKQVNPVSVKFPTGEKLTGQELQRFYQIRNDLDRSLPSAQMAFDRSSTRDASAGR